MPSRAELKIRAACVNLDATQAKYANDSVLEQAVLYAETNMTAKAGTATTIAAPSNETYKVAGAKNV